MAQAILAVLSLLPRALPAQASSLHVRVDAFGYLPAAPKVAVLREPVVGYDAGPTYTPGATIEVRRVRDGTVAWRGTATRWNGGAVHAQSGDRCWSVDFSDLRESGSFFLIDPTRGVRSEDFAIGDGVYRDVLRAAVRMYFYQRCGAAKATPHAHPNWADGPCHLGAGQDRDCRPVLAPTSNGRDLSGGWHDAGDYNKYVNYADGAVHELLHAYAIRPDAWPDDAGIPESGNGVSDLLDEIRYELEFLLKMQLVDGSLLHKVSVVDFSAASPPSADHGARRHAPATASATISGAGVFGHAALVFGAETDASSRAFAQKLRGAALAAWGWLEANPTRVPSSYDNAGFQSAAAEDSPYDQQMNRLRAAVFLFELTGDAKFRASFDSGYAQSHLIQWSWVSPYEGEYHEAFLRYTTLSNATPAVATAIRSVFAASLASAAHLGAIQADVDPYRAPIGDNDLTWGSNRVIAAEGSSFALANRYGLDVRRASLYFDAAQRYLHRLHGVNPGGHTYLTNMRSLGAEGSVDETYHAWFADGTAWDNARTSRFGPAPGYLTGGVNRYYAPDPSYSGPPIAPPQNQPFAKCYRDWNAGWPQNSWAVTECHIPYQASYVRLLAEFALAAPPVRLALHVAREPGPSPAIRIAAGGATPVAPVALFVADRPGRFALSLPGLCLDLGLGLLPRPEANVVLWTTVDSSGVLALRIPVANSVPLYPWWFQLAELGPCPTPVQSAVAR
ncbi:MAG: glycoside hydrolase family 9 protein [Planctomycetes bacterium]|nr:glycoside hydrolase family 9 protein [Planctomycetota bacterium]